MAEEPLTFAVPMKRLADFESEQRTTSMRDEPYRVLRRKTHAVMRLLDVDEETAEAIVLKRIDYHISAA